MMILRVFLTDKETNGFFQVAGQGVLPLSRKSPKELTEHREK